MQSALPYVFNDKAVYVLKFYLDYSLSHNPEFTLKPDDCVKALRINKEEVRNVRIPFCDYVHGKTLDLGHSLKVGENLVEVIVENTGGPGGFEITLTALRFF